MKKILAISITIILAGIISILIFAQEEAIIEKLIHTDANLRVAFIGDQGLNSNSIAVLNLIKDEGAQMVLHQGDLDYEDDPDAWDKMVSNVLGDDFPYFVSVGNHDVLKWDEYQQKLYDRLEKVPDAECIGDLGVKSSCIYKGLHFIQVAPAAIGSGHSSFIESQLSNSDHIWRICSFAGSMNAMQVGEKKDIVGWEVYNNCKNDGAIIATAHEHSYHRTKTLIDIENQITDPEWPEPDKLRIKEDYTFVFVSGIGGHSIRDQDRCLPFSYPYGCNGEWAEIYTSDQNANYGALFCTFNVGEQPNKVYCYFKNIDGRIIDAFTITSFLGTNYDNTDILDMSDRNLTGDDLSNRVIIDGNLSNAILVDADLSNSVLIGTTLTGADFTNANLTNVILNGNDLTGTVLRGSDLTDANLNGIDLSDKDLTGTVLRGSDLTDANLNGIDLSGRDLTGVKLSGIDLSDQDLTGTILRGSDLTGANLTGFDLSGRDITGAILRGADLSGKNLTGTILRGVDLTDAILPNAYLSGNNFKKTILNGIDLSGKDLSYSEFQSTSFKNTNLQNVNFSNAKLLEVDLTKIKNKSLAGANLFNTAIPHSNLSGVNLDGVNLGLNNFQYSNLSGLDFSVIRTQSELSDVKDEFEKNLIQGTLFGGADLSHANFEGVVFIAKDDLGEVITNKIVWPNQAKHLDKSLPELSREFWNKGAFNVWVLEKRVIGNDLEMTIIRFTDFSGANLQNVNFSNADLTLTAFRLADLTNANLSNAILVTSNIRGANLQNVNFSNADLTATLLKDVDLTNANLSNATLTGADLTGADLTGADLTGADLTGANLTGVTLTEAILNCKNHPICVN